MRLTSRPTAAQLQEVLRFARRAGFALTPQALLRHQALWGSSWVGGYRRHLWRELLLLLVLASCLSDWF